MSVSGLAPGSLIDYRDGDGVTAGVILREEKGRLLVVSESGREERIAGSRVALVVAPSAGASFPSASGTDAASRAVEHARRAAREAERVELETLWELLVDSAEGRSLHELSSLALGSEDGPALGAVLRSLLSNRVYFVRKDELWYPRARGIVEEMLRQHAREEEKARARERFVRRARAALGADPAPGDDGPMDEDEEAIWRIVESVAMRGQNATESRGGAALLREIGFAAASLEEAAFRIGLGLGRFREHENLLVRRFALDRPFTDGVRAAAARAAGRLGRVLGGGTDGTREDLRGEDVFTIDAAATKELDDGLSLRLEDDGSTVVGIHIADPSAFIEPGDPIDREAESRGTSHYLPERRIPMLPPEISEDAASLLPETDRPALSFLVRFSPAGERVDARVLPSVVRSRRRITYEEANAALGRHDATAPAALGRLWKIAQRLEEERMAAGAVRILAPEVEVLADGDGRVEVRLVDAHRPGRRLVAELMVLACRVAAETCLAHRIPVLFRRQAPPEDPVPETSAEEYDPVAVRRARKAMQRSEVGTTPGTHAGLGLPAYVQATSPLRRYSDLLAHRQIAAHLSGRKPPHGAEDLQRLSASCEEAERQSRLVERGSREYWVLRYLEARAGETVEGVVTDTGPRRTDIELSDTLHVTSIPSRPDHAPGQRLRLVIERAVPRAGLLSLREA